MDVDATTLEGKGREREHAARSNRRKGCRQTCAMPLQMVPTSCVVQKVRSAGPEQAVRPKLICEIRRCVAIMLASQHSAGHVDGTVAGRAGQLHVRPLVVANRG